ncbi:MAG: RNA polymerase sigma factor RpoH [Thiotrichales bacterium]
MTKELQLRPNTTELPVVTGNLQGYIYAAYQLPVLSQEEEHALAKDLQQNENIEAARQLILHNLRYVIKVARGYLGYGLPLADLVQEGNIGLMKAVKRFDPDMGVRLVSFAVHWIRAEIHEYILRNWRIVKVATTKAQRKLFFNLRGRKKRLGWLNRNEIEDVAKDLGVKPEDVEEMELRLNGHDIGFDLTTDEDDDTPRFSPAAYLTHDDSDPAETLEQSDWQNYSHARLTTALASLDQRSRDILNRRWISEEKETLQTLADEYGVSAERIRQLENNAMKKLRSAMEA